MGNKETEWKRFYRLRLTTRHPEHCVAKGGWCSGTLFQSISIMSKTPRTCKRWTDKENEALAKNYRFNTSVCWDLIASDMHFVDNFNRSAEACRKQWERLQKGNQDIKNTACDECKDEIRYLLKVIHEQNDLNNQLDKENTELSKLRHIYWSKITHNLVLAVWLILVCLIISLAIFNL